MRALEGILLPIGRYATLLAQQARSLYNVLFLTQEKGESGGIGRRAGFRFQWGNSCESSSLSSRTSQKPIYGLSWAKNKFDVLMYHLYTALRRIYFLPNLAS